MSIEKQIGISSYIESSSGNYGLNSLRVDIGELVLYFSYKTVIAYRYKGDFQIRENIWGQTTGRHLNAINSDKSIRISGEKFNEKLTGILKECGVMF